MKKLFFGTNLKMYKNVKETREYLQLLQELTKDISREEIELFVIPSYTSLDGACACTNQESVILGAQNMCWEEQGQFTGEISPFMLQELGIRLVMIGHSERRHVFGETNATENLKVKAALAHNMTALLCIGETLEEKEYGISDEVLRTQLKVGLHNIPLEKLPNLWIAYEPVWAIGKNGIPASPEYAQEKHQVIKQCLTELFQESSAQIPVLYGGSVNPQNADQLIVKPDIDGLFTGRSAWDATAFNQLIRSAKQVFEEYSKKE